MGDFWSLEPEVAGALGDGSVVDVTVHPPLVTKLQYSMMGWLGDDLLETFPCYIATERLADELLAERLTGFQLGTVDVVVTDQFTELYPGLKLPGFRWLRVSGEAGTADFGISKGLMLVVSDAALHVLKRSTLANCGIEAYEG
ncbi:MAG: hypothetical protein ACI9WU_002538 [Myxococcota bacterium]|jgi:hypothetical protein